MTKRHKRVPWRTERTDDDVLYNEDLASAVLENVDDIMIALDKLGWKVVSQIPDLPFDDKWPMSEHSDHCPRWCLSVEEDAAERNRRQVKLVINADEKPREVERE